MPEVGGVFGFSYPKENLAAVHEDVQTFAMDVVVIDFGPSILLCPLADALAIPGKFQVYNSRLCCETL